MRVYQNRGPVLAGLICSLVMQPALGALGGPGAQTHGQTHDQTHGQAHVQAHRQAQTQLHVVAERIDVDLALASARLVGLGDQIELIVTLPLDDEARRLGAVGRQMSFKGICGPDGAPATPDILLDHARRDLERMNSGTVQRGTATAVVGTSPRFVIRYDDSDPILAAFYLPSFLHAAQYVDSQLDDRVDIWVALRTAEIDGAIGTAGSVQYLFSYEWYRRGLMAADNREPEHADFANGLPTNTLPVTFISAPVPTAQELVVANMAQVRAIYGNNVIAPATAVTITFDRDANWDFGVFVDNQVDSGKVSLVDVAIHEITHGLGFRSEISEGGINGQRRVAGLDIARFRYRPTVPFGVFGGVPLFSQQFTTFPRVGANPVLTDQNFYARPVGPVNALIELEAGDSTGGSGLLQPSHLAFKQNFNGKLGLMDPVITTGRTFGPLYWGVGEIGPLDDMGWKPVRSVDINGDCNGNGVIDRLEIVLGWARDADNDSRLDICETFLDDVPIGQSYIGGLTQTIYDAQGATLLGQFDPVSNPIIGRSLVPGIERDYTGADTNTFREFSGFMFVPAPDEYAFRVRHGNSARLKIGSRVIDLPGRSMFTGAFDTLSLPIFVQLEAGWHELSLTTLVLEPGPQALVRESHSLGGWGPVPSEDLAGTFFADCNSNDVADEFDLDCDANGVPDACEPRGDVNQAVVLGPVGREDEVLGFGTCDSPPGFRFDTDIAIWNASGTLLASNDDSAGCATTRLSRLSLQLPPGDYIIGITGSGAVWAGGFGVDFPGAVCGDGGAFVLRVGSESVSGSVAPGKAAFYRFTVDAAPSCPADLALPFGVLNFFDVTAFLALFNAQDPAADFAVPFGTFNFFDVTAFLSAFNAGCP